MDRRNKTSQTDSNIKVQLIYKTLNKHISLYINVEYIRAMHVYLHSM